MRLAYRYWRVMVRYCATPEPRGGLKMRSAARCLTLAVFVATAGCDGERVGSGGVREDSVALAAGQLTKETFDTIAWPSDSAAVARGAVVWTYSCRKCHGTDGSGDGRFVQDGDTLRPPSLLTPAWRFADDRPGAREQIFTGTTGGMPHWGVVGLKPRDIDAVTLYIERVLRW
jgi:mono/diheme cytochrome c family protein